MVTGTGALDNTRGRAVLAMLEWADQQLDALLLTRVIERLSPANRALIDPGHAAFGLDKRCWYPSELGNELLDGLAVELGPEALNSHLPGAARHLRRTIANSEDSSPYAAITSTSHYTRVANALWRMTHSSGKAHLVGHAPGRVEAVVDGWRGHHATACQLEMLVHRGTVESFERSRVRLEPKSCVSRGGADCRSVLLWEPRRAEATSSRRPRAQL